MTKHVVLSGASSGIGRALAILLSQQGYRLSLCGRDPQKLAATQQQLAAGCPLFAAHFDATDRQAVAAFCLQAEQRHGPADILINCAGANNSRSAAAAPQWLQLEQMMQLNFYAPLCFIEQLLPAMLHRKQGCILNVLSTVCLFSNPGIAAYTATKAALDAYSKVLRKELHGSGVKVLSVYPGGVDTDFRTAARPEYLRPAEVADAISSMLSAGAGAHMHELVIRPAAEVNFN
ncbi:SDR family oxidoreductase [Chromatiaceae bacterium AAb-1]|nr:SDR family oxidoreductase [Chromatiaceae bacterium AAb-1]